MIVDPLRWQLRYADGTVFTEPLDGASIRIAPSGAAELWLIRTQDETPFIRIELLGMRPIFYRRRSIASDGADLRLDATVFGRASEDDTHVHSTLWAVVADKVIDCPQVLIDQVAIENLVVV